MNIYGLDLSLATTGFAVISTTGLALETIGFKQLTGERRLAAIVDAIFSRMISPRMVAIEGLSYGSVGGQSSERAALHWMVRVALIEAHVPFAIVAPKSLKKYVSSSGLSEKGIMIREVFRRWNIEAADDNQADAAGLAKIAESLVFRSLDLTDHLTKAQSEVLEKIQVTGAIAA
jgi:Holliday junction resolvasome RuvABC endonuclease subunit